MIPLPEVAEVARDTFRLVFADTPGTSIGASIRSREAFLCSFGSIIAGNLAEAVRCRPSKSLVASCGAVTGLDDCCRGVSEVVREIRRLPGAEELSDDRRSGMTITGMLSFCFLSWLEASLAILSEAKLPLLI